MNKSPEENTAIRSHGDLMAERKRLENKLIIHKALLIREFENVRTEVNDRLQPATQALDTLKNIKTVLQSPPVLMLIGAFLFKRVLNRHESTGKKTTTWLPVITQMIMTQILKRSNGLK